MNVRWCLVWLLACGQASIEEKPAEPPVQEAPPANPAMLRQEKMPKVPVQTEAYIVQENGLKRHTVREGEGDIPQTGSILQVEYTGWLENGTIFDSSYRRAQPFSFAYETGQVIQGWLEGTKEMKKGEIRQLVIPPALAYGDKQVGEIPANSTLIFQIELLSFSAPRVVPPSPEKVSYQKTASGLEYAILTEGSGASPQKGQEVSVEYTGWLEDGTVFDSSYKRTEPIRFPAGTGRVIPGWDEALLQMKLGEKRQVRIPPQLAYGKEGKSIIPPNATLIFQMDLVQIH